MNSDTARMISESAARIVEQIAPAVRTDNGWIAARQRLWTMVDEAGLLLALAPEEKGGLGLPLADIAVLTRLWGRHALPGPIVEPLLAQWVASICDLSVEWHQGSIAIAEPGAEVGAAWWPEAERLLVVGDFDRVRGYRLAPEDGQITHDLAGETWLIYSPKVHHVEATLPPGMGRAIIAAGSLLTAAAMLGTMEHVRDLALEYACIRRQFGKPLAAFQAIQQMLSSSAAEVQATRAILDQALLAYDGGETDTLAVRVARARASRGASIVAAHAHQILGAIGYTDDHELHRFTKRLWAWRDAWSRQCDDEATIGRIVIDAGGNGLLGLLTGVK